MSKGIKSAWKGSDSGYGIENRTGPTAYRTPYSSAVDGTVTLDPRIEQQRAGAYGDFGAATSRFLGNNSGIRDSLAGNQGAFIQARVNPLLERFASLRGRVQQDMGQRGIGGSTFGYNTLRDLDTTASREEADARALATQETMGALRDVDADALSASQQYASFGNDQANQRLAQELQALGLGQSQIQQMIGEFQNQRDRQFRQLQETRLQRDQHNSAAAKWVGGGGGGKTNMTSTGNWCYVAEELYGVDSPITHEIRAYVGRHANDKSFLGWFLRLYKKQGKAWAKAINKSRLVRFIAKPIWDRLYRKSLED
jgi:hypothetical protein